MPRAPDERYNQAYELYKQGLKLVEIASQLNIPDGTIRRWKSTHKWDSERSDKTSERSGKKRGGQKGNKNATGPPKNKNAETHGFFAKWLPEETAEIIQSVKSLNPLDILWDNIQLQYAAIIRAQKIMFVTDKDEMIKEVKKKETYLSETVSSDMTEYEFQFAWDRQATFMNAQSRALSTLNTLIKQYDDMLHKNWDACTEEQKQRIEYLKTQIAKSKGEDNKEELDKLDQVLESIKGVV